MSKTEISASDRNEEGVIPAAASLPYPEPSDQSLLARWGKWWGKKSKETPAPQLKSAADIPDTSKPAISTKEANRLRALLRPCFQARLTDVAANRAARAWQEQYQAADASRRFGMLQVLGEVGAAVATVVEAGAKSTPPASDLAQALSHARVRFFKRLNGSPDGMPFMLALRTDMLRWRQQIPDLRGLDADLESLLSNWFDVGLLELRSITWDSPASLLEKLIAYEAVHEIASWADLRNRLDSDRRCYAFFHPRMPTEPLIFVEVAFCAEMAGNIQGLLDEAAPLENLDKARWAIFYSISNTQAGLRGVSFGNFLLKRVIEELNKELPKIKRFATLSPIPGFGDWLKKKSAEDISGLLNPNRRVKDSAGVEGTPSTGTGAQILAQLQQAGTDEAMDSSAQAMGMKLAARYLVSTGKAGLPVDAVARFHLGNGARIERLNWNADVSKKGRTQSAAMMVNYLYELDALDDNLAKLGAGQAAASRGFSKLL